MGAGLGERHFGFRPPVGPNECSFFVYEEIELRQKRSMDDITNGERIAADRIEEAAQSGQDWLDLAGLGLVRLPHNLEKLNNLQRLSIGSTYQVTANGGLSERGVKGSSQISDLHKITKLGNLKELFIEGIHCTELV